MINNIILKNVATYDKKTGENIKPSKINFVYGNNGTGKTTITRVIENPEKYKDSQLLWDNDIKQYNTELKTRTTEIQKMNDDYEKLETILNNKEKENIRSLVA